MAIGGKRSYHHIEPTVHPCGFGMGESHGPLLFPESLFQEARGKGGPQFKIQNNETKGGMGRMGFPIRYRGCSGENTPRVSPLVALNGGGGAN